MPVKKFLQTAKELQAAQRTPEEPKAPVSHDESNWLVSYADMMTLLCGFFIMLFSMAKMDEPKYEKVQEAMSKQFGGDFKSPQKELAKFVTQIMQEAGIEKQTVVKSEGGGVSLVFESTLFFDSLSADVKFQGKEVLTKLIASLAERQGKEGKQYKIVIEGHTDNRPVVGGPYPSNWELSGARASRVVRMFLDAKFSPENLTAIGYADTRPQVPGRTELGTWDEEALAKNRRVVLRILDPKVDSIPYPEVPEAAAPKAAEPANSAH